MFNYRELGHYQRTLLSRLKFHPLSAKATDSFLKISDQLIGSLQDANELPTLVTRLDESNPALYATLLLSYMLVTDTVLSSIPLTDILEWYLQQPVEYVSPELERRLIELQDAKGNLETLTEYYQAAEYQIISTSELFPLISELTQAYHAYITSFVIVLGKAKEPIFLDYMSEIFDQSTNIPSSSEPGHPN